MESVDVAAAKHGEMIDMSGREAPRVTETFGQPLCQWGHM
jgi:hypothetical protein